MVRETTTIQVTKKTRNELATIKKELGHITTEETIKHLLDLYMQDIFAEAEQISRSM